MRRLSSSKACRHVPHVGFDVKRSPPQDRLIESLFYPERTLIRLTIIAQNEGTDEAVMTLEDERSVGKVAEDRDRTTQRQKSPQNARTAENQ